MTNPASATVTQVNAWAVNVTSRASFDYFVDATAGSAIKTDDLIVLASLESDKSYCVGIARAYRVRVTDTETTIFFNAYKKTSPKLEIPMLSVIEPSKFTALRLDWEKLRSFFDQNGIDHESIPAITGESLPDQAYIRKLLSISAIDDLRGPALGPNEEIVGMSVRDRYLVGKLAPRVGLESDFIEGLQGPTAENPVESESVVPLGLKPFEEQGSGKEKAARRRMPGEEFNSATGKSDSSLQQQSDDA